MIKAIPYIGAAACAALLAWSLEHYRMSAELAVVRSEHTAVLLKLTEDNATELEEATRRAELLQQQVADIDAHYTQELTNAKANADRLRDAVDSGARRLHILGQRPASCPAVSGTADDTGVGDGAAVELHPSARRAYFNLRAGLSTDTAKLEACQLILKSLSFSNKKGTPEG